MPKTDSKHFHRGWLVFFGMCCNAFAAFLPVYVGMFSIPLAEYLQVSRGTVMSLMVFFAAGFAISSPIWGQLHGSTKIPVRLIMTTAAVCQMIALALFATAQSLWQIYIAGAFTGIAVTGIYTTSNNIFASTWFASSMRGKLFGLVNCCAGIGAIVWPLVIQFFISNYGWRAGIIGFGVMSVLLLLPWCLFVYERTPEEKGLKPLGYEKVFAQNMEKYDDNARGVSLKKIYRSPFFYLLILAVMCLSTIGGYETNFSGIVDEGLTTTQWAANAAVITATMLSVDGVFDLSGNLIVGIAIDKFGIKRTSRVWLVLFVFFFVFLIFFRNTLWGLYIAGALFGLHTCIRRTVIPLITRRIYGSRNYAKTIGWVMGGTGLVNGLSTAWIAFAYDLTGSYQVALIAGLIVASCASISTFICLTAIGRYRWTTAEEDVTWTGST